VEVHLQDKRVARMVAVLFLSAMSALPLLAQAAPVASQGPQPAENTVGSQVVHVIVGHSIIIRTEARVKRILIGNPAVLSTETASPTEVVATATAPGSSSLILWHENGQSRLIEVFSDIDAQLLRDAVRRAFPNETIEVEAEEGRVILSGVVSNPAIVEQLTKMASAFAKEVVNSVQVGVIRAKQVMLKVRFAEVDRRKLDQFGINILSTGAANTIGTIGTQQFGSVSFGTGAGITGQIGAPTTGTRTTLNVTDLLNIFVYRPDLNLGAVIKALEQKNVLQILAEPNLLAVSGEPAKFLAGGELPYPIVQPGTGGQNTVTVQFKPFGVKLDFTGFVEGDSIRLKVAPEVSAVDYTNSTTVSGSVLPAISTRRAETVVELKSGQSFGIAGLLDQRTTAQLAKVPGIGNLPIIGHLFKSRSVDKSQTELLVIVTPTIVDPTGAPIPDLPAAPYNPLDPTKFDKKIGDKNGSKQ
jgi:pilus assembly protein CpaC